MRFRDHELRGLAAVLAARYPGVRILNAWMIEKFDKSMHQVVEYEGSLHALKAEGLVTDEMVGYSKLEDLRRRRPAPPVGDSFWLREDSESAVLWRLTIYTDATSNKCERMCVREARRILKSIGRGARPVVAAFQPGNNPPGGHDAR